MATFPITSVNFSSATAVAGVPAPLPAGTFSSFTVAGLTPGTFYYFAIKTTNHSGQVSAISSVLQHYSGDFAVALDPSGNVWELGTYPQIANLNRTGKNGNGNGQSGFGASPPWKAGSQAIGFDGAGNAYALYVPEGAVPSDKPRAVLTKVSNEGVFLSSTPYRFVSGQPSSLNVAPDLQRVDAVDSDGETLWIAGGSNGYAGLWRTDPFGLNLAGLSNGATAQTVLANGYGAVWLAGSNGELIFWRYDVASGEMARHAWSNTLGGSGSSGQALVEDTAGNVWIGGWARTPSTTVAALWRWDGSALSLVATSTGAYSDRVTGLTIDTAGRFWLSGRSQAEPSGSLAHVLWQYPNSGGVSLIETNRYSDFPPHSKYVEDHGVAISNGLVWTVNGPAPAQAHSRTLDLGDLTGSVSYPGGFSGGNVVFFLGHSVELNDDVFVYGSVPAPSSGTVMSYTLGGLPAPATYFVAAVYDLSGTTEQEGNPGPNDPIGLALTPTFVPSNSTGTAQSITMAVDQGAPQLAILSPVDRSTIPLSLFTISGTATDDLVVSDLRVGLKDVASGMWWDSHNNAFIEAFEPLTDLQTNRVGPSTNLSWTARFSNTEFFGQPLVPGRTYSVYATVSDVSGHTSSATATFVLMSTAAVVEPGYASALRRDASGNLWTVTRDFVEDLPVGFSLRKYDSGGLFLSSTTLPQATDNGNIGIAFDPSGNAWIGGSAGGDDATTLAVWKVSASGLTLLSHSTVTASTGSIFNGGIAADSFGNAWVTGAEQTSAEFAFKFGLWKFSSDATLAPGYPVYHQRTDGSVDGGFTTAIDGSGNIWSAGVSVNPATGRLDMALWKYTSAGTPASGFPVYWPDAFLDINATSMGLVANASGGVWVAASKAYPMWSVADLALLRYDASGVLVSSSLWHGAGAAVIRARDVALDAAGNPWVVGSSSDTSIVWRYGASGALAAGYPRTDADSFNNQAIVADAAGTPWVIGGAEPEVFAGTVPVPGAAGPSYWSFAGYSSLSGTLTYPAGFIAGSTVSIFASSTGFRNEPSGATFIASSGTTLAYTLNLIAPASYQLAAFVGTDPEHFATDTPIGIYNHFASVPLSTSVPTTGVDFVISLDTTPPTGGFVGIVSGSSLTALASIQGTATDDRAYDGRVRLSAQDLNTQLWWDAARQDWVASTTPVGGIFSGHTASLQESSHWLVDAHARFNGNFGENFGGFSDFLPYGHTILLTMQAVDLVGNHQVAPSTVSFTWLGVSGADGRPSQISNLAVSILSSTGVFVSWNAPGEHQNVGTAASYDLRYATYPITEINFSSATAAANLPTPRIAGSGESVAIFGLNYGFHYYFAIRTTNHEGSISFVSNVVHVLMPLPGSTPRTALTYGPPSFSSASLYATSVTTFGLVAADDRVNVGDNAGPGIAQTFIAVDTTVFSLYGGSFTLSGEGAHSIQFYSVDLATHTEGVRTSTVALDMTPPLTSLAVLGSSSTNAQGSLVISSGTAIALAAADPFSNGVAAGVRSILYLVDVAPTSPGCEDASSDPQQPRGTCANKLYAGPFTLAGGTHTIYYLAGDNVANQESVHVASVTVLVDSLAPRTALTYGPPSYSSGTLYATNATAFGLSAVDDLSTPGDGAGFGVARTFIAVDTNTFTLYSGTFSLSSEGLHSVQFYSVDVATHSEIIRSTSIAVDLTAPLTQLQVLGSSATGAGGEIVISSATRISLSAADPLSAGVASGLLKLSYIVDADPLSTGCQSATFDPEQPNGTCANSVYGGPFALSPGTHTVYYASLDKVGNQEGIRVASFTIPADSQPPRSSFLAGSPSFSSSTLYAADSTTFSLAAVDDLVSAGDAMGLGVAETFLAIDTATFSLYQGTFSVTGEGVHSVQFYSRDTVGNSEATRSTSVAVDQTPPATELQVLGSSMTDAEGRLALWSSSSIQLTAQDPVSAGVASGVRDIFYVVDVDPTSPECQNVPLDPQQPNGTCANEIYNGAFNLAGGTHTIYFIAEDNVGNQEGVHIASVSVLVDLLPPRTSLVIGDPQSGSLPTFVSSMTPLSLAAVDDRENAGDAIGIGVAATFLAVDGSSFTTYAGTFTLVSQGTHTIHFYSVDAASNTESVSSPQVVADTAAPQTSITVNGEPISSTYTVVSSTDNIGLAAVDAGAGVFQTLYALDAAGLAPYLSTFSVSAGTHTLHFRSADRVANEESLRSMYLTVISTGGETGPVYQVAPGTGPIGIPFSIAGAGFGAYAGSNTRVKFGATAAPLSVWNDTAISGTVPGLSTGAYAVVIERQNASSVTVISGGNFEVLLPSATAISASSVTIGAAFTLSGSAFGPYAGTLTRVLIGGATAPLSVWNDTTISGTVPGLSTGTYSVQIQRATGDGGLATATPFELQVVGPGVASLTPSSGPIGVPFTLSGSGFGPYAGSNTRVLVGGTTAPISVWNDATITGTIPGIAAGTATLIVERRTADGFISQSEALSFEVTVPSITTVSPSSAPIGAAFTLTGLSFGPYAGTNTQALFDGTTAPISVWNDHTISGTVPGGLAPGAHELLVERRTADGGVSRSSTAAFIVQGLALTAVNPSTGAIGIPFTLTGMGFGAYAGANTRVKFGVSTAAISVWNDGSISGTVPTLATGPYAVTVERQQGADVSVSNASTFTVIALAITSVTPSAGPIGTVFTLSGGGFGPYAGANTYLLLGGATTSISVWNDSTITAAVPGALTAGVKELVAVRRNADGGLSVSNTAYFEVTDMSISSLSPSTGPIGIPFTITGGQFGVYMGANTRVRFGASTAAVSIWNDTTIAGTVPSLSTGTYAVVLERQEGSGVSLSNYSSFTVTELAFSGPIPSSGPIGVPFTLSGSGFGPYAGTNTRLLLGGTTVAVSVWNDTTITGAVPNLEAGSQPLWIERKSGSGVQSSATSYFLVTTPAVATLVPSSAPIGAPFNITGSNFGPYAGANTRVRFNGVAAPISTWNDTTITGTVPGALSTGAVTLVVERAADAGLTQSTTQAFEVLLPVISTVSPSYGPVGTVVILTGHGFGPYAGTATKLLVGGSTVAVSVWNDTAIHWTVPDSLSDGDYALVVRRTPSGGSVDSGSATFTVGTGYGGASFGFAAAPSLAARPDSHFEGGLNLPVDEGGRVETPSKAAVSVPPNALAADTEITLKRLHRDGLRASAADAAKVRAAGEAIEFGPEGTRFNTPVTIELPYDPALTTDESQLAVHYYDPLRRVWEALPSVVDRARRVVKAQTAHFSIYQPMGLAPTTAAQDEFFLRDQYAFPNPSRNNASVTFRIQPGLADTIELRVYDLSGRKIHSSSDFTFRGAIDDGNGKGNQNTYDHAWDVSGVGSGVYTYVLKASRAGQTPIVKSGKVGIIK